MTTLRIHLQWMWPVITAYIALCFVYHMATPILEASDEARHVAMAAYIAQNASLPIAGARDTELIAQEATQAPLYYVLTSLIMRPFDLTQMQSFFHFIPGNPIGRADLPGSRHMFAKPETPNTAQSEFIRAVHLTRIFSAVLVGLAVVMTMATVRCLTGNKAAAAWAGCLLGFNPMVLFIGNSVNNDNLAIFWGALFILMIARMSKKKISLQHGAALGAVAGIAVLSKLSCVILVPVVAFYILFKSENFVTTIKIGVTAASTFLVICGWWFVRNVILYNEFAASMTHMMIIGNGRDEVVPLALLYEWHGFIKSFWGVFGAFNIIYPDWVYHSLYGLTVGMLLLSVKALFNRPRRAANICGLLMLFNLLAVAWWTSRLLGSQGRLLFPSLSAIVVLPTLGSVTYNRTFVILVGTLSTAFLFSIALWAGLILIPQSYF